MEERPWLQFTLLRRRVQIFIAIFRQSLVVSQELIIASLVWHSVTDMQELHSYW